MEFKKVCIVTRYSSMLARDIANIVADLIIDKGSDVYTIAPLSLNSSHVLSNEDMLKEEKMDLVIAIGGDGTALRAVRWIDGLAPVFSIRIKGSRGVLADINTDTIHEAIDMIYANKFYVDERMRIHAISNEESQPALNEIMISKASTLVTPTYNIELDDYSIKEKMDGLIISTPIGSSGYSYSLGGPIMHEQLNALIITPIASINRFPILIVPELDIKIKVNEESMIFADGQYNLKVDSNEIIRIKRHPRNAKFLRIRKRGLTHLAKLGY
ncbi:MAG: NAD(+)/NADH kinase [Candidatus Nitrosothermus koennekii]|nr:MAG: NAD(+)/NADH kinase [Candidatus Nitrosothermus koennekii]